MSSTPPHDPKNEMELCHRDLFTKEQPYLLRNLSVGAIFLAHLFSQYVITQEEQEMLMTCRTSAEKVIEFCNVIIRKGPKAYGHFINALEESSQDHIKLHFEEIVANNTDNQISSKNRLSRQPSKPDELAQKLESFCSEDVEMLLDFAVSDARNNDKLTVTQLAADNGKREFLAKLLSLGADLNVTDHGGQTLLHRAARGGHNDVIAYLLGAKLDVDIRDRNGMTCLHTSILSGNSATTQYLINEGGANIRLYDIIRRDPLFLCCQFGDLESCKLLLEKGAARETRGGRFNQTALHVACINKRTDIVELLLDRSVADIDTQDDLGKNPLYSAFKYGYTTIIESLLRRGPDVNINGPSNQTPLHWACIHGNPTFVRMVLDAGAHLEKRDDKDQTPLHTACNYTGTAVVVKMLLDAGADHTLRNCHGWTPFYMVSMKGGDPEVARVLIDAGADCQIRDSDGETNLQKACWSGNAAVVSLLLDAGADPRERNPSGKTARDLALARVYNDDPQADYDTVLTLLSRK